MTIDPLALDALSEFKDNKLYGSVEIKFQAGRVVLVRTTQTKVPLEQKTCNVGGDMKNGPHNQR